MTTHSPYILEELPLQARAYILQAAPGSREFVYGVSPEFAMAQMDDVAYYECDLYVEDGRSGRMLTEILSVHAPDDLQRCQVIPYGAASVGQALGQMVVHKRFPRPSCVFLDGDNGGAPGCALLPGEDAPERVVFESLKPRRWVGVDTRIGRQYARVVDVLERAMTLTNHHEWVTKAGTELLVGGDTLWQAMTAEWAANCLDAREGHAVAQLVTDMLAGIEEEAPTAPATEVDHQTESATPEPEPDRAAPASSPPNEPAESASEPLLLFEISPTAPRD
jgi:hypothetical protein